MSAYEQRKLLEQLMGAEALDPKAATKRTKVDLNNPKICKAYLVDFCGYNLLSSTKSDWGTCPNFHQEQYKIEYATQKAKGREFPEFEQEFERHLAKFVNDCNRKREQAEVMLRKTPEDIAKLQKATKELEEIDTSINLMLQEINSLSQSGQLSFAFIEQEKLKVKRTEKEMKEREIRTLSEKSGGSGHQKLQVCQTCGAYLSRLDNDKRLADHFMGRMHKGFVTIRAAYEEIRAKNAKRREQNNNNISSNNKRKRSLRY